MLKPTKILVPTDFSEYSDKALKQGLDIAKQYGAKLYLLHVVKQIRRIVVDYPIPEEDIAAAQKRKVDNARITMQKQLDRFPQAKEVEIARNVREGYPSEEILMEEAEKGVDLIVIASHGATGLAKYFIGSVARKVLIGAKAPVLFTV
jgi:nucleotide-binding universal stress UspA family protein